MKFSNSNSFFPNKIYIFATAKEKGTLAQVVEQWTENPCVLGSTPRGTTLPLTTAVSCGNCLFCFPFRRQHRPAMHKTYASSARNA